MLDKRVCKKEEKVEKIGVNKNTNLGLKVGPITIQVMMQ